MEDSACADRALKRWRTWALIALVPYVAASLAVGIGLYRVASDALTFALFSGGFLVLVSLSWVIPVINFGSLIRAADHDR